MTMMLGGQRGVEGCSREKLPVAARWLATVVVVLRTGSPAMVRW